MLPILTFKPIYKSVIWGGRRIADFKGIPPQGDRIGESWEISPMPGAESIVAEGPYRGKTLNHMTELFARELLGNKVAERFSGRFPLLVKFIDSTNDLSVQVHPDDDMAKRHCCAPWGKTELWYALESAPDAYLYAGFNHTATPGGVMRCMTEGTLVDKLNRHNISPGDVVLLPAGTVHALGKGSFVVEIQQASDITYRLFDYDRLDDNGNPRPLHIEEALKAIHYDSAPVKVRNVIPSPGKTLEAARSACFSVDVISTAGNYIMDLSQRDSFTILISVEGDFKVSDALGDITILKKGETLLVPAYMPAVRIDGEGRLLSVYI